MQHNIPKLCADSLRSYLNDKYGIKLKSGHAHEIVAAFFGYKSRIAMLADKKYPVINLDKAKFILLDPPTPFVDQRLKSLEGLSPDLPSSYILAEGVYSVITGHNELLEKVWPTFTDLATHLAEQRLHQRLSMFKIDSASIKWEMVVDTELKDGGVLLTVDAGYRTDAGEHLKDSKYTIHLPRVAANLGYGTPKVDETRYSGDAARYSDEELLKRYPIPAVIA